MKFGFLFLFLFLIVACDSDSNLQLSNENYFVKYFGNDGDQEGVDMIVDVDGNYYLLGTTDSKEDGKQVYLVKADAKGDLLWEKTFGGKNNEQAVDLLLTTDNKLAFVSNITSAKGVDIFLATLTLEGEVIKSTTYGLDGKDETAYSLTQTTDGFLVAGSTTDLTPRSANDITDGLQLRFFSDLTVYPTSWRKTFGFASTDVSIKIVQNADGKFYLFGYTNNVLPDALPNSSVDYNYVIFELGFTGEIEGTQLYPGREFNPGTDEQLSSVVINDAQVGGGFTLFGQSYSQSSNSSRVYVVGVRNLLTLGDQDYLFRERQDVNLQTPQSLQTVVGCSSKGSGYYFMANQTNRGKRDWYLDKIDNNGLQQWAAPVILGGENDDRVGAILELPDGKIALLGTMQIGDKTPEMKMALIKVNSSGKFAK